MKRITIIIYIISLIGYSQTPITNSNFKTAINKCLSSNRIDGLCSNSEYGSMPDWDVSQVTNMDEAFNLKYEFNADISSWDVSNVTSMRYMFEETKFNQDISSWDVSNVKDMTGLFWNSDAFNQDISSWDVSNVTYMGSMFKSEFYKPSSFNQDISSWDVSNVIDMGRMFRDSKFNQDISSWDVSNVINMGGMFEASEFNQDISSWDVSKVNSMNRMFYNATAFNQDISSWDVSNVTKMDNIFSKTGLSIENYDAILSGWFSLTLKQGVNFGAAGVNYCNSQKERQGIIDKFGWIIIDDGLDCSSLSTKDNESNNYTISLYPNPVIANIFIKGSESPIKITIYNAQGKKISTKVNIRKIDVKELPKGIYMIRISNGEKKINKKFIKL
ncbi:BspA family leucine-rich repeat surface protein [uncultured Polaribacter sp.]|uniref:BspA family leucine-rich repeat surface protein n=1 Tax=uncultured Polaribacter sp. TaxID=174711 RepID=UPI00259B88C9|nr:BspA family leucine-rich repeat surface protein [uncultured Polaribacter sp.]